MWEMVVINDDERRIKFLERHPGKLVIKFIHVPDAFGRLLAKIGYGQILTTLDPGDFDPICLPYIIGQKSNVSYVVGGSLDKQQPEPENGYSLSTAGFGTLNRLMLVALIRLYANTHSPAYHVIVGDVKGPEKVGRVLRKLDVSAEEVHVMLGPGSEGDTAHWLPEAFSLPFWA